MRYFQKIADKIDVFPLLHAITKQQDLWDANNFRTTYKGTPHVDVNDILIRYSDTETTNDVNKVLNDYKPVWYPAFKKLPQVIPLVSDLMKAVNGYEVQRVIISRIKPGGQIKPHADNVGDYVQWNDIARYHIVLQGLPGSLFNCGDEQVQMLTGSVWWFDALSKHSVLNNSTDDRIHLMVDIRAMQ